MQIQQLYSMEYNMQMYWLQIQYPSQLQMFNSELIHLRIFQVYRCQFLYIATELFVVAGAHLAHVRGQFGAEASDYALPTVVAMAEDRWRVAWMCCSKASNGPAARTGP